MKNKYIKITLASLFLTLACLSNFANANLIVNGDFLAGGDNRTSTSSCTNKSYMVGNGNGGILLNGCGSGTVDPSFSQIVSGLTIGDTYELFWDRKNHHARVTTENSFGVYIDQDLLQIFDWSQGVDIQLRA